MDSPTPNITEVRLARPSDIDRMATVIIAGHFTTQSFAWHQPHYARYPIDALRAMRKHLKSIMMMSTNKVLVVAEDEYLPDEHDSCSGVVTSDPNDKPARCSTATKIVVGVASYVLPRDSPRIGQYQDTNAIEHTVLEPEGHRDTDLQHNIKWWMKEAAMMNKYFTNTLYLQILSIHPAYQRRSHGTNLVQWGIQLAKHDRIDIGLISSEFGGGMYKRLGFRFIEGFEFEGDEASPRGVRNEVLRWNFKVER